MAVSILIEEDTGYLPQTTQKVKSGHDDGKERFGDWWNEEEGEDEEWFLSSKKEVKCGGKNVEVGIFEKEFSSLERERKREELVDDVDNK